MMTRLSFNQIAKFALGAAVALSAVCAQASPLSLYVKEDAMVNAGTSYLGLHLLQPNGTQSSQTWNVYVGSFLIDVASSTNGPWQKELAFCVDPWNWSTSSSLRYLEEDLDDLATMSLLAGTTYDIKALTNPTHVTEIEALYSNYYRGTLGNTAKSAAFQLALWEIVSDNHVDKVAGTNMTIWNDGHAILSALESSHFALGSQHYDLTTYYVDRGADGKQTAGQNYLVASAIPEPGSLSLAGLALAGLLHLKRRKA
jgi:hypothetical protein